VAAGPVCPLPREVSRGRAHVAAYPATASLGTWSEKAIAEGTRQGPQKPWRVPRRLAPSNLGRGRPRKVSQGQDSAPEKKAMAG
jgi:hypothetical protein